MLNPISKAEANLILFIIMSYYKIFYMNKRKFRTFCNEEGECWKKPTELIVEIEDSPNVEQEAANALCRKLEQHFKDKHPKEKRNEGRIAVNQGDKWTTLQSDGTIKELAPNNAFNDSGRIYQACENCDEYLIFFVDGSKESHNCSSINNPIPRNNPENPNNPRNSKSSDSSNQSNKTRFNFKNPLVIGGIVLSSIAIIGFYLFIWLNKAKTMNKIKDKISILREQLRHKEREK